LPDAQEAAIGSWNPCPRTGSELPVSPKRDNGGSNKSYFGAFLPRLCQSR